MEEIDIIRQLFSIQILPTQKAQQNGFNLKTILSPKTRPLSIGRIIFSIGTTVIINAKSGADIITAVAQGSHSKRFFRFFAYFYT